MTDLQETARQKMAEAMERVARETLGLTIMEERGHDSLDFHEFGVLQIRSAIAKAYLAGYTDGRDIAFAVIDQELEGRQP